MPLPTPNKDESKDAFISRCAGNDTMNNEFPDQDQRLAVCYSQWREKKENKVKKVKEQNIIEIQEDLKIGNVILEKGDKIQVLNEQRDEGVYIVYVKGSEIKRWMPMGEEGPVINLIHAVIFGSKEEAEKDAEDLKKANPKYDFEVRKKG
jgi:hypothetical protein